MSLEVLQHFDDDDDDDKLNREEEPTQIGKEQLGRSEHTF